MNAPHRPRYRTDGMTAVAPAQVTARFDDLGPGGGSFCLAGLVETFAACTIGEVAAVLRAAEHAARQGHWVAGFVTYEAGTALDPTLSVVPRSATDPLAGLPLAWFAAFERREEVPPIRAGRVHDAGTWELAMSAGEHRQAVEQVQRGIARGSFYQVNLTSFLVGNEKDIYGRYGALAARQASSYNALITTTEHAIVSASPELFLSRNGLTITTRPMKGTAARGRWSAEDDDRVRELKASEKERAENVMIVDLTRNDLARIAEVGTVTVPALLQAERYPTVWQLTSTVSAQARTDIGVVELFEAMFPPGSVTGAPKAAAMAAISTLESRPRGVYCGAVGYIAPGSPAPPLRFAVAIRTLTTSLRSGYAEYGAGGGITASSDPGDEWAELFLKTRVLRDPPTRVRALLETLRYEPRAGLVNLDRHLDRLDTSAHHFGFAYDREAVEDAVHQAVGEIEQRSAQVRITLSDHGAVAVATETLEPVASIVELAVSRVGTVTSDDELLFHKLADRGRYERIRAAHAGVDDVVLVNEDGHVTETTTGSLAIRCEGRWWTPPLSCGLLPGVERARMLDAGTITERTMTTDDLAAADAIAVLSSLRGMRPARLTSVTANGPRTPPSPTTWASTTPPEGTMPHTSCAGAIR